MSDARAMVGVGGGRQRSAAARSVTRVGLALSALAALLSWARPTFAADAEREESADAVESAAPAEAEGGAETESVSLNKAELSASFNDPLTTLPQLFVQDAYTPSNYGTDAQTNRVIARLIVPRVPRFSLLSLRPAHPAELLPGDGADWHGAARRAPSSATCSCSIWPSSRGRARRAVC